MTHSGTVSGADPIPTVWVFGDQLHRDIGALTGRAPGECRILLVRSRAKIRSKPWHVQRLHVVLSAMAHFAAECEAEGFDVDLRDAASMAEGLRAHREACSPSSVVAMEPMSWDARDLLDRLGVEVVPNDQFLCGHEEFAEWADGRARLRMEDFYRWQRTRLGILMEPDGEPSGGNWNFDADNRERPPKDGRSWPTITEFTLDDIDEAVLAELEGFRGAPPTGRWPVTRSQARQRLEEFVSSGLPVFGPHEDAMLAAEWKLAHSVLSSSLNLGLLRPDEVIDAAESAYRDGSAPIASVEGFIRQVLGWREYVWGMFWLDMPAAREANALDATRPLPPAFTDDAETEMACVSSVLGHVHDNGYAHHIERLMVLGNLALTSGIDPRIFTEWMWASFVDAAEWVMVPNVMGMALFADGGRMATKPYASGGAYIDRMSDHCKGCRFDPKRRTGEDACPFTTLYWDFLARNDETLDGNHRMARQLASMRRLSDLDDVRARAVEILGRLDSGDL